VNVTAGATSSLGCARKLAVCCLICWIFCGSGFFAAAVVELAVLVEVVGETDALADAAVAGVVVAPVVGVVLAAAAGVVLAVAVAGLVVDVDAAGLLVDVVCAGVVVVVAAAGLVVVLAAASGAALGDVFALFPGAFLSLLRCVDCSVLVAGVALALVAGCSAEVFVSGAVAGAVFVVGGALGAFLSGFVAAGDSVVVGSFAAGASGFSFTAGA
jgi:hypothetical protein